jgi:hypothetical protein
VSGLAEQNQAYRRISAVAAIRTPEAFRDVLLEMARSACA